MSGIDLTQRCGTNDQPVNYRAVLSRVVHEELEKMGRQGPPLPQW